MSMSLCEPENPPSLVRCEAYERTNDIKRLRKQTRVE